MEVGLFFPFNELVKGGQKTALNHLSAHLQKRGFQVSINDYSLDADLVHILHPMPFLLPLVKVAHLRGLPVVYHVHSTYDDTVDSFKGDHLLASYVQAAGRRFSRGADAVVTPTQYTKDLIVEEGWADEGKVHVISNGVDTEEFQYRRKSKVGPRAVVGGLSTVMPRKGVIMFLETARRLPRHPFVWYGKLFPGRLYSGGRGDLKEAMENKPENAFFHGYARDLQRAYGTMDIFTSFSTVENEGIPPLEAAALGIPLVLRPIPPYLEKFEGAALFADGPDEAADKVKELVGNGRLRNRLRRRARRVAEKYDFHDSMDRIVDLYRELVENA